MKVTKVTFSHDRETKGTHRYAEDAPDDKLVVGNLYIKKQSIDGERPEKIEVTIKPVK